MSGSGLKLALAALESKQYTEAIRHLQEARKGYPSLADYLAFWLASACYESKDGLRAITELEPVWHVEVASPHGGNAALLAGRAYLEGGNPPQAIHVLRGNYEQLPQPAGDLVLASSYEAAKDLPSAALYFQRVYFSYPVTPEAAQASIALVRLKDMLGDSYPPATAEMMFQRAERWRLTGNYSRARTEYESIISRVAGADREIAQVRMGSLDYHAFQASSALRYLRSLSVSSAEADAERLYWVVESARRADDVRQMMDAVNRLAELYPTAQWRLKALVTAGNYYLVRHEPEIYEPLFKAGSQSFGSDPLSQYCHWKITWSAYLNRRPEAAELLRTHLLNFPGSEKDSAALYYLGRLSEEIKDINSAAAYYREINENFPNYYYAGLAEKRLSDPAFLGAVPAPAAAEFLKRVVWPVRRSVPSFEANRTTKLRFERARLLESAGLDSLAEQELRFGAKTDGQPHLAAMRIAETLARTAPHQAIRLMKNMAPGYLSYPLDSAPKTFWRPLFPLPYRSAVERNARLRGLDPFIIAGLIRQESEFNAQAVSPANAYGLTQVMPSTGRQLMRRLGQRRFRPSMLFNPDVNLRLGIMYLRQLYDQQGASWEQTLAAYNAGGSRVQNWISWAQFREPSEFIETIPFTETRNYVFAVLRNAEVYRALYGATAVKKSKPLTPDLLKTPKPSPIKQQPGYVERNPILKKPAAKRSKTSTR